LLPSIFCESQNRAGAKSGFAVSFGQGYGSQPQPNVFFVPGMDITGFAKVDQDRLASIGQGERLGLSLAQFGPTTFARRRIFVPHAGQLAEEEWKIPTPSLPPVGDHERECGLILAGTTNVRFPLVPDGFLDCVRHQGRNHSIV
jgi:hypothetical protein